MVKLQVELLAPSALGAPELTAWRAFRAAAPHLAGPYFAPEYALAADGVAPGASVAVLHHGGAVAGFLPLQQRGGLIRPLGAPLSDYHGVIAAPDAAIDLADVARALKTPIRFSGLVASQAPTRAVRHSTVKADVSRGWDAYLAARPHAKSFFKGKRRAVRALERDCGPMTFRFQDDSPGLFEFVLAHKRAQFRRTGRHDIFACGWTEAFLRRLWETRTDTFGGRFVGLYAGDRRVAAEYLLAEGPVRHLWFPVYDPDYARYGVGALKTVETLRAAAADPDVATVDFGRAGEPYKLSFGDEADSVYEGEIAPAPPPLTARAAEVALRPLGETRERLRRRLEVIGACETTTVGLLAGAFAAFNHATSRRAFA